MVVPKSISILCDAADHSRAAQNNTGLVNQFRINHSIEDVLRDALNPGVVATEVPPRRVLEAWGRRQHHVPPAGPGIEHEVTSACGVQRRRVRAGPLLAVGAVDWTFRQDDETRMRCQRRAVIFPPDKLRDAIPPFHIGPLEHPVLGVVAGPVGEADAIGSGTPVSYTHLTLPTNREV